MKKISIEERMKGYYQEPYNIKLPRRTNVIIRLDGKAFHTYTKGLERPFDINFANDMNETTKYLCENIQGCKVGYVQSDEISLLLTDYDSLDTSPWFDNKIQKIVSVAASIATAKFNQLRYSRVMELGTSEESDEMMFILDSIATMPLAMFDARVFIIPEQEEVINYFIWRQQDATRNSISMLGQSHFSHKELQHKSTSDIQDMLMDKFKINWNDCPIRFKRGSLFRKIKEITSFDLKSLDVMPDGNISSRGYGTVKTTWDNSYTPIITKERDYFYDIFANLKKD